MHYSITDVILYICVFLFGVSAIQHYFRKSLIPQVCWVLLAGVLYGVATSNFDLILPQLKITPDIVLYVLLPVLIFDSSRTIPVKTLNQVLFQAGFYATIGVLVTMFLIAIPFSFITGIPFLDAIFLGAIMAATDPVAVGAIFKNFSFPERLKGRTYVNRENQT